MPIDGTRLRGDRAWVMNPSQAAAAAQVLGAPLVLPSHADSYFSDPVLKLWASVIPQAAAEFVAAVARVPGVRCALPRPGDVTPLA